ncbi:retrotransposon protein, putative, ty3-gypsy subclass [Tanacetum coccineum]
MDLMSRGYKPYLDKFIDDISICSSRNEEHEEHLRHTLETFKNKKLYCRARSATKCEFCPTAVLAPGIYYNASHNGLSVIMMHKEKAIAYNPRQLEVPEKDYPTPDLEIGEIVFSFKIWERYLYGIKLTMFTTHKSLQHILDQREMNMRPRRLLKLPSNYNGETRYRPGKANIVAERSELSLSE